MTRSERLSAIAVFAVVLTGYVWTLAPTVTFWDAGEFIAAAKILGIPHPPGTPLFVLMGHVWGSLLPIGEFAYRTNLMAAVFSAAGAALFFLLISRTLQDRDPVFRYGGAAAASVMSAFVFTVWQNSNETEVYMVATFSIALICWLAYLWRAARGTGRAPHILLLIVFLAALSLGAHLLTLLVGPALIGFMFYVQREKPLPNERDQRVEWAQWAVVTGIWALLIGTGLGSTALMIVGGVFFLGAAVYALSTGSIGFAATVLAVAVVGASTYLFLYVRAQHGPYVNEADPSTWAALKAVIRREQYPVRSPFDDPMEFHDSPENLGRSPQIIWWQVINYLQYFDWQWANGLAPTTPVFAKIRLPFTLLFTSLGIYGASVLRKRDRAVFWLLLLLFLTTGPGLMGYMNFKPGYSLAWDLYPGGDNHEVRERDYFFTVSFLVWGLFTGIGVAGLYRLAVDRVRNWRFAAGLFAIAAMPFMLNLRAASRAHGPEAQLARDFAYNVLQSVEPYGIVFTNGDNDTFPLWYLQEAEGVRQDVQVVNLSLVATDWFIRQMRDNPVRPFDPKQAPHFAHLAPAQPPPPAHSLTDAEISQVVPQVLPEDYTFRVGPIEQTFKAGTVLYQANIMTLRLIQENLTRRPIYFSITSGSGSWMGLSKYLTEEALVLRLHPGAPKDSSRFDQGLFNTMVDVPRSDSLAWNVYRYARLFEVDSLDLDPTSQNIASNLSIPFLSLGNAWAMRGNRARSAENFRRAYQLSPSPQLKQVTESLAGEPATPPPLADTARRPQR